MPCATSGRIRLDRLCFGGGAIPSRFPSTVVSPRLVRAIVRMAAWMLCRLTPCCVARSTALAPRACALNMAWTSSGVRWWCFCTARFLSCFFGMINTVFDGGAHRLIHAFMPSSQPDKIFRPNLGSLPLFMEEALKVVFMCGKAMNLLKTTRSASRLYTTWCKVAKISLQNSVWRKCVKL